MRSDELICYLQALPVFQWGITAPRRPWSISTARRSAPGCPIAISSSMRRRCFRPSERKCMR